MARVIRFPDPSQSGFGFERVKSTYSVRDISRQFGLSERYIRRWTLEGLIETAPGATAAEPRYDFHALDRFRRIRELRTQGLTLRQIDAEMRGQLNLFPKPAARVLPLTRRLSTFEEALTLQERGDPRSAEFYRKAVAEEDHPADAYCNLGIMAFEAGDIPRAFDCFTRSLGHDPRHFESHFNLANLYLEIEEPRLAILHYEMAAEIEPCFSALYFNLGLAHAMKNDLAAAVAALGRARELAAEDEEAAKIDAFLENVRSAIGHSDPGKAKPAAAVGPEQALPPGQDEDPPSPPRPDPGG